MVTSAGENGDFERGGWRVKEMRTVTMVVGRADYLFRVSMIVHYFFLAD